MIIVFTLNVSFIGHRGSEILAKCIHVRILVGGSALRLRGAVVYSRVEVPA